MAVIYQITNMANGHYYIGSAESFARREWQHKYDLKRGVHKNPHLQAAWNKYGADAFVFEVIEEVPSGVNPLQIEDTWLVQCVGRPDCYNINACAESPRSGMVLSAESREKVSVNRKGKAAGKDHYRYGKTLSDEVKAKIGATQKGKPKAPGRKVSAEGLAKIKANIAAGRSHMHWLGKRHTEDAKAKMSRPVAAISPTAVETVYASITALREALGLTPPTVNRALKSGSPLTKGKFAGWKFVYVAYTDPT
jgi:group I intron endonuclease